MAKWPRPSKVPFDENGNLWGYVWQPHHHSWIPQHIPANPIVIWKPNYVFEDRLTLVGNRKGRSGVITIWSGTGGVKYEMFWSVFLRLVGAHTVTKGVTEECRWTFMKRGASFSIYPVGEE